MRNAGCDRVLEPRAQRGRLHKGFRPILRSRVVTTPTGPSMFFDADCGPCRFWARLTVGLSRSGLRVFPLDGSEADRALRTMSTGTRYRSFHIVEPGRTWTGPDAMPAWVGLVGGSRARLLAERAPPVKRLLRRFYTTLWAYRQAHGCAAARPAQP